MGQELACSVLSEGKTSRGKALLESNEILFRKVASFSATHTALKFVIPVAKRKESLREKKIPDISDQKSGSRMENRVGPARRFEQGKIPRPRGLLKAAKGMPYWRK